MAIRNKFVCPVCQDDYPIVAFIRDADDEVLDAYMPADWEQAYIEMNEGKRTLYIAGDTWELSTFCAPCGKMIGIARERMENRLGHGKIKTKRADGQYVDMESHQEYMYMVNDATPQWQFATEDETTRNGEPLSFTDVDLAKLSMWRIRSVLNNKGFTDIPWHEIEDHAQNVSLTFLEKLKCAGCGSLCYMPDNTPCEVGEPAEDIDSLHAYHWACCRGEAKRLMSEYVQRRKAQLPEDILDLASVMNMSDEQLVFGWHGRTSYLDQHEREQPLWKKLDIAGLEVDFGKAGIHLSNNEVKILRNAIIAHSGESKDAKNKTKVKRIIDKIGTKSPDAYKILMGHLY